MRKVLGTHFSAYGDSQDGKGLGLGGSMEIGPIVTAFVDLGTTRYEEDGLGLRFVPATLGVGGHVPLSSTIALTGGASYEHVKVKASVSGLGNNSESFGGWGLGAGARGLIGTKFQWNAGLKYRDLGDLNGVLTITIGGRYHFAPTLAVGLDLSHQKYDSDFLTAKENIATVSLRYDFGTRG